MAPNVETSSAGSSTSTDAPPEPLGLSPSSLTILPLRPSVERRHPRGSSPNAFLTPAPAVTATQPPSPARVTPFPALSPTELDHPTRMKSNLCTPQVKNSWSHGPVGFRTLRASDLLGRRHRHRFPPGSAPTSRPRLSTE